MLVSGYQCIGKSTLAKNKHFIDLESSLFNKGGDWVEHYIEVALHLNNEGYCVLLSAHNKVREYMDKNDIEYTTISPDVSLRVDWICKLHDRYKATNLDKDLRAYERARNYYIDDVEDMQKHENSIIIKDMNYVLYDMLLFAIKDSLQDSNIKKNIILDARIICGALGYNYSNISNKGRSAERVRARVNVARRLCGMGYTNEEIAFALNVDHSTVNYYINKYVERELQTLQRIQTNMGSLVKKRSASYSMNANTGTFSKTLQRTLHGVTWMLILLFTREMEQNKSLFQ